MLAAPICAHRSGGRPHDLGAHLYDSLHNKLLPLPDETLCLSGAWRRISCGKKLSSDTVSTLGDQRRLQLRAAAHDKEEFIQLVTADQPTLRPTSPTTRSSTRASAPRWTRTWNTCCSRLSSTRSCAWAMQARRFSTFATPPEYAQGHLAGSINIGLGGQYATWAGTVLDRARPIVIIAEPGREQEAALRLGRIGFDHVKGYLKGGHGSAGPPAGLGVADRARERTRWSRRSWRAPNPPLVLDVRNPREWDSKHIDGSVNVPLNHLQDRIAGNSSRPPPCGPLRRWLPVVHCSQHLASIRNHAT